ncbi:MAG: DUF2065 family protein [Lysobacter sp.]|nr:MAG: DUF2065 family protein [Lysobacter sp.]
MNDLWAALALVAVLEGLVLFAFPGAWKRTAKELLKLPEARLRRFGAGILVVGLVVLYLVRGG